MKTILLILLLANTACGSIPPQIKRKPLKPMATATYKAPIKIATPPQASPRVIINYYETNNYCGEKK